MIKSKFYKKRNAMTNLIITYSDSHKFIHKIGTEEIYDYAIDVETSDFKYEELETIIPEENRLDIIVEEIEMTDSNKEISNSEAMALLKEVF